MSWLGPSNGARTGDDIHSATVLGDSIVGAVEHGIADPLEALSEINEDDLGEVTSRAPHRVSLAFAAMVSQAGNVLTEKPRGANGIKNADGPRPPISLVSRSETLACLGERLTWERRPNSIHESGKALSEPAPGVGLGEISQLGGCSCGLKRFDRIGIKVKAGEVLPPGLMESLIGSTSPTEKLKDPHLTAASKAH